MKAIMQRKTFDTSLRFALSNTALRRQHTDSTEAIRDYVKTRAKERNTITVNTKRTRLVIIPRENPDTPPVITDHVRELARLIRNTTSLVRTPADPLDYKKSRDHIYLDCVASNNTSGDKYRAISVSKKWADPNLRPRYMFKSSHTECGNVDTDEKSHVVIDGLKWKGGLTCYYLRQHEHTIDNVNTNDKPAFRHDSMYLFDILSEDYSA